jgi:hypothetical protein
VGAERRARLLSKMRAAVEQISGATCVHLFAIADMVGMRLSALRFPFVRMILSEKRTPLFGIMRAGSESFLASWW